MCSTAGRQSYPLQRAPPARSISRAHRQQRAQLLWRPCPCFLCRRHTRDCCVTASPAASSRHLSHPCRPAPLPAGSRESVLYICGSVSVLFCLSDSTNKSDHMVFVCLISLCIVPTSCSPPPAKGKVPFFMSESYSIVLYTSTTTFPPFVYRWALGLLLSSWLL